MRKFKSNIKKLLCVVVIGHMVFLMACGSAGGVPLGPSANVFPPNEALIGDWNLEVEVTKSDCDEVPVGATDSAVIAISEENCGYIDPDNVNANTIEVCQASLNQVDLNSDLAASFSGCDVVYEEILQLNYNPETDELTGTLSINLTLGGSCEGETVDISCSYSGVVTSF